MRTRIDCCEHCIEERHPGCGATCNEYKDQKAELEATKAFIKNKREADSYVRDIVSEQSDKRVKKHRKTRGYSKFRND